MMKHKKYFALFLPVLILLFSACKSNDKELDNIYNSYRFDASVIEKLPIYDSLAAALTKDHKIFMQYADQDGSQAFYFMPLSGDGNVYKKFPPELNSDINRIYKQLGEKYVAGFDIYRDSSIKIYIRRNRTDVSSINIDENLSYVPEGKKMKTREFPAKDSILNSHWQYWVRVNEEGLF